LTSLSGYVKIRPSKGFLRARTRKPPETKREKILEATLQHSDCEITRTRETGVGLKLALLALALILAAIAGVTDWRSRRIPNWLTVSGLVVGIAANGAASGLNGLKTSLLGAGLGLLLLLPFVFLRSLGAGDWKLAGALGAIVGPGVLVDLLMGSIFVAGIMALALVIYKRRLMETLRNIGRMLRSMLTFHMPGAEVSLDNPQSLKIPYGVALALTTLLYGILNWKMWGAR
jgi:prepilin peptidase CpaA